MDIRKRRIRKKKTFKKPETVAIESVLQRVVFSAAHKKLNNRDSIPLYGPHKRVTEAIVQEEEEEQVSEPEPLFGYSEYQKERGYGADEELSDEDVVLSEDIDLSTDTPLRSITSCLKYQHKYRDVIDATLASSQIGNIVYKNIEAGELPPVLPASDGSDRDLISDCGSEESKARKSKKPELTSQYELIRRAAEVHGFMYLVYAVTPESEYYTPYCIKIVTFEEIDRRNFMTMSNTGVTQYHPDGVTYTPLDEWKEQYDMYLDLIQINSFRQYRMWKAFWVWRKAVKWAKLCLARNILIEELLILNKELRKALFDIHSMCYAMDRVSFTNIKKDDDFMLFDFIELQMEKMENVMERIEAFHIVVKEIVTNSCYASLSAMGYTVDDSNFLPPEACTPNARRNVRDKRQRMQYIDQANKKKFCKRLACFIHLVDNLVMHSFHLICKNSLKDLQNTLKRQFMFLAPAQDLRSKAVDQVFDTKRPENFPQKPFFHLQLLIEKDSLNLDPPEEVTLNIFNQVIEQWNEYLYKVPTLLPDAVYNPFTEPMVNGKKIERFYAVDGGVDPKKLFTEDTDMVNLKESVNQYITVNYTAVKTYIRRFDFLRKCYKRNEETKEEVIKKCREVSRFREWLNRYHKEVETIDNIVSEQSLGIFLLHLERFKETIAPSPQRLLYIIEDVLPNIGREKVDHLVDEAAKAQKVLTMSTNATMEYVTFLEFLDNSEEKAEKLEAGLDYCKEIYDLIDEFEIPVSPDEISKYLGFNVTLATLRSAIDQKMSEKDGTVVKFTERLNKDISLLMREIADLKDEATLPWLTSSKTKPETAKAKLNKISSRLNECQKKANRYKGYQRQFKVEVTRFDLLDEVVNDVRLRRLMWKSQDEWAKIVHNWMTCPFEEIDPEQMQDILSTYLKYINQLEKGLPENQIVPLLKENVEKMKAKLPVITNLRNPAMKPRHWLQVEHVLNYKFSPDEKLTLERLEELGVFQYPEKLQEISGQASSEVGLELLLKKVEEGWKSAEFIVLPHRDYKDVYILGGIEEIQTVLDESMININTISSSRHVGPIKPRVDEWAHQLELFSKTLDAWLTCQQNWLYLESIFSAPDIQRQLPSEARMFQVVDKSFKDIMRKTYKNPLAMQAATASGVLETFENNNELLDEIMKCLEAYLESKRVIFPRFYFLSNEELLEILAQTRNPHAVQPHLRKCFDAIAKLEFGTKAGDKTDQEGGNASNLSFDISAMISPEGERVALTRGLKARGNVEDWLGKVEDNMFFTLKKRLRMAVMDHGTKKKEQWIFAHPNQIILTASQIIWSKDVHIVLDSNDPFTALEEFEEKSFEALNRLAAMVRGDLSKLQRSTVCSLITIDVHSRDIITSLVEDDVDDSHCFEWLKQLRYYWDEDADNCIARMSSACHFYGYEYLGASPRLVITPLTDRCYLCLMGALQMDLGGAPAGPAGTGKTETTKDLAKSLAIQCVVFNCSEGLDFKMMGKFFSGLAQSGAWCCFDEFNRIDIEVLSVIAQQLITIRNAKVAKAERFMFEGREIKLVPQCAAFITMNPGYAGRTELPDNLKALFRPISMMVPDYALIAEVILYSEGFESSKNLAHKMTQMYKLCSEQLSQQDHYDFGMRAVKSVLVMAGSLKRDNPDTKEDIVLIRALRDSNIPKFLVNDCMLFQGILNDLFPGVEIPEQDYGVLLKAMKAVIEQHELIPQPCFLTKIIQFYETMIVRHGVMLVGPTGGGKTTILKVLKLTLTKLHKSGQDNPYFRPVKTYTLNPKSITLGELYGAVHPFTFEWKDGLMGIMMRKAVQSEEEEHQWIVCDGPVDAVWIENMNTVLDDNKMLCLANSERIKLTQWVHMLFEVQDLAQASPATVSRCGMVYVDSEEMGWKPFVQKWANQLKCKSPDMVKPYILNLFDENLDKGLLYVKEECEQPIKQVTLSVAATLCSLIESIVTTHGVIDGSLDNARMKTLLSQIFCFSYVWAVGGNLSDQNHEAFEIFARELFEQNPDARIPSAGDLWALYLDTAAQRLDAWTKLVPEFKYNPEIAYFDTLVPTVDTVRFGYLMEKLVNVNKPILFTGTTGVGKSVIVKNVLNELYKKGTYIPIAINFSAQTSSARTQQMLENKLEKRKKTLLGPPTGKKVIFFVDDVNMPKLDTYGAQPPIELLRQYLDFHGLYDRDKMFWKEIKDVILAAACAPPGGGRNPITSRFTRHFTMLLIPTPNTGTMKTIFKQILAGFLEDFSESIKKTGDSIVNCAIDVYNQISNDLLPTPDKSHYVFNLRDLSKCIQGVLQADSEAVREAVEILRLFYHECLRVFHDRLINIEDKSYFYRMMKSACVRYFSNPILEIPDDEVIENPPVLLFADCMSQGERRLYEEVKDIEKLKDVLTDALLDYNLGSTREMKLIFFMDAITHILRIARIVRFERGNALLVGVAGMGKQSLTRLASHLCDYKCFQIELTRSYDHDAFREDLRKLFVAAGAHGKDNSFLITDTQIVQEEFLEDINNMLNSGDVPNLFESDEYEQVIIAVRPIAKAGGVDESNRDGIFEFFISRVRSKLHVVISMSPVGDTFRSRCRMFPSLVNCCTIDWFIDWPEDALFQVALSSLRGLDNEELVPKIGQICVNMHLSVGKTSVSYLAEMRRHYYTTPSSYLDLLKLYKTMLETQNQLIKKKCQRIESGLQKILETNVLVDEMKLELQAMEPELQKKSEATEKLMLSLAKEQEQADKVRQVVLKDEGVAKSKAKETQALAEDAQKDLEAALPAMVAAMKALESLNKNDINELRVFNKPPQLVRFVMEAVCLLMGAKTDWASAKAVLGDTNFLKKLQEYDKDNIPDSTLKKLKDYIKHPDFVPETVATQSKVCKSICMWVRAIDAYAKVYRIVEPKRKRLQAAESELNSIMAVLKEKQQKLAEVEAQIAQLEASYDASVAEKTSLEHAMELTATRLLRSGKLTTALGDERGRWEKSVQTMKIDLGYLIGDILLSAACIAYFGAFTSQYREKLLKLWVSDVQSFDIPSHKDFNLIDVLADPFEIRNWNTQGLPRDSVSTENAVLVTKGQRWPLMIDPQEQANRWIRNMESGNNLKVVSAIEANLQQILEGAVRVGLPILLEGLGEEVDPSLSPILQKNTFIQGGRLLIRLGDKDIEYDTNFRFYMTTKLANPHYLPEVCIMVTLVNFTVTRTGLEDQLLSDVVRLERPDLEKKRNDLVTTINNDKNQLEAIEEKILKLLFTSKGNILDDEELIETLNESKETSSVISKRLKQAEITEESITKAREKYRSVAARGSVLYFVVAQISEIDPMYQYSLKYFNQIFNVVIENSPKSKDLQQRLNILYNEVTLAVYTNISRGLFERHKLIFSFMLCVNIMRNADLIHQKEWNFLLRGPVGATKDYPKKPDRAEITPVMWNTVVYMERNFKNFKGIIQDFLLQIKITLGNFQQIIDVQRSSRGAVSEKWDSSLNDFQKLMVLKALQEEKLVFAIMEFVARNLGKNFIESPQISLNVIFADTSKTTPLIFILSTGSDPFGAFQRFAAEKNYTKRIQAISLGQGQGPIAEGLINAAIPKGDWVFLQNCHLATSWMVAMEKQVQKISDQPDEVHKDFRLFLSSMPNKDFPVSVLQNSVKVTNEPPKGLRANLKRAFADMRKEFFEENTLGGKWRTMVFGLCLFHAVIQERKKFGPLGWNIIYEFNDSDRECALTTLEMFCAGKSIPWDALEYITGEITYGGRVTDYWDLRCLKTILKKYFSEETLKPGYQYSTSKYYFSPESPHRKTLDKYRMFIESLPTQDDPDIFGMHENANIAFQTKETNMMLTTILEIQPRESSGTEGRSSDDIVFEQAEQILGRFRESINAGKILPKLYEKDKKGRLQSLTTVLIQEIDRYNGLLKVLHQTLENLQKAIKGLVVMSESLEQVFTSILNNQVPQEWRDSAYPSLKSLASWVKDLEMRIDYIVTWMKHGKPQSYWISGFFFPQGFLTGTLQTHARKYDLPIDQLKFDFAVTNVMLYQEKIYLEHVKRGNKHKENVNLYEGLKAPDDGVLVHGIFIDAASWSLTENVLIDAKPGEVSAYLPVMVMTPTPDEVTEEDRYHAPLYKTSVRAGVLSTTGHSTNFVITCILPCDNDEDFWVLRGSALLTQLTD